MAITYSRSFGLKLSRAVGKDLQGLILMAFISALLLGGLGSRLAYLQLVEGARNQQLAGKNRIRLIPKPPQRGRILDRKGRTLAGSRLSYSVLVWPIALKHSKWPETLVRISQILQVPAAEIQARLERAEYTSPYLLRIARGLSPAQVTALEEYAPELEGVMVDAEVARYYPHGDLAAHVLGYTGELRDDELERFRSQGYRLGDVMGQMGLEAALESKLRGEWGGKQVEVNSMGQVAGILGEKAARSGQDVQVTLDLDLQKAAEDALGKRAGAIVALNPQDGAILAMASRPTFDPNIFSTPMTEAAWRQLQGRDHPFVNRALQSFPPASTFKIVTTAAAIESGRYSPDTILPTYPFLNFGGIQFWEWNQKGFGPLGFPGALAWSSDTFFYQIGAEVGGPSLIEWARRFGFGRRTGVETVAEETPGLVPDEAWKQKVLGEDWYLGDTINTSIGQGFLQTSPLQVAMMFAVPANGGYLVQPHFNLDPDMTPENWQVSMNLKPVTLQLLRQGLRQVVRDGTGEVLDVPTLPPTAGKSGTAEDPPRLSHAWFGAYTPADNPEIVVVAFAENSGGGGSAVAAPMVRQVLETYVQLEK